jgi:ribosomal protein S18 acetylase RimI-like enzyme
MKTRTLTTNDFTALHRAFLEAFSDYFVPFALSAEQLTEMLRRRGYVPERSVGVFDDDRMVAFTCNGAGQWHASGGPSTALYDSGTGVVPAYRRRGLARQMFELLLPIARETGASRYVLEVLEPNEAARNLYTSLGFSVTRRLQCWSLPGRVDVGSAAIVVEPVAAPDWSRMAAMRDVNPSWQNSDHSIDRAGDEHVVLAAFDAGAPIGFCVVFPRNGDLAQLAVSREHRRRGVGHALLDAAVAHSLSGALRIINVDDSDAGIASFLRSCGAVPTIAQFEMVAVL